MADDFPPLPPGFALDGAPPPLPEGFTLDKASAPRMREEPFTEPMSGQVMGTQTGPETGPGPLLEPAKFAITAGARGLGSLADFATDPMYMLRSLVSPELAQAERHAGGPLAAPGSAAADAFFKGTGIPEYKPDSAGGRLGLAAATGAVAGGPFGALPAALTAAGGLLGQGTMEATDSPRAAVAASMLPMLAGRPLQAAGRGIADRFAPYETQAATRLARDIGRDTAGGGLDINGMREAFTAPEAAGKPLALADVGGPSMQGRGEAIANRPGPGAQVAETFLTERDAGAGPRLLGDLNDAMGAGPSAFKTAQTLANQRSMNAQPLYEKALQDGPPSPSMVKYAAENDLPPPTSAFDSPRLREFLNDPLMRPALANGVRLQRIEAVAQGKPFDPNAYSLKFNPDNAAQPFDVIGAPNMRTLDAGKVGLDAMLDEHRDPYSGRLNNTRESRAVDSFRRAYVGELDSLNPDYAAARAAWSGPSQSMSALKQGADIFALQPEQIAENIQRLAPGDKDFFLLGARDALAQRIAKTSTGGNEALRITGNQHIQNQLRPLFETDAEYNAFIGRAKLESAMYRTMQNTLGNSRTFRRAAHAEAENANGLDLGSTLLAGVGGLASQPLAALPALMKGAKGISNWLARPSPEVDTNIARMLFSGDPQANAAALQAIEAARRPRGGLLSPPAQLLLPPTERGR